MLGLHVQLEGGSDHIFESGEPDAPKGKGRMYANEFDSGFGHQVIEIPTNIPLVILRGLPGSGKSTLARALAATQNFVHVEADQFLTDGAGNYRFDPERVADAHAVCQQRVYEALRDGKRVVIANTHVRLWELAPYVGLASLFGATYQIVQCHGKWQNVHNVSDGVLAKMQEKWEPLPNGFSATVLNFPP
jgi:predicted kinase